MSFSRNAARNVVPLLSRLVLAAAFIPWISGSYPNVVGLALVEARGLLLGLGYEAPDAGS